SRPAVAFRRGAKSRDLPHPAAQSNFAANREMDTTDAPGLFRCGTSPELRRQTTAPKVRADSRPLFQSTQLHKIGLLPPLHGASKMCAWHLPLFLETPQACLYDRNYAHSAAGRCVTGEDEIASAALPPVSRRPSQARIARAPTVSANWSGRARGPVAFADDYFALGPKVEIGRA